MECHIGPLFDVDMDSGEETECVCVNIATIISGPKQLIIQKDILAAVLCYGGRRHARGLSDTCDKH